MDLLIFAKKTEGYAVDRLAEEARGKGLVFRVVRYDEMSLRMSPGKVVFMHLGKSLPVPKLAVFRVAGRGGAGEYFVPQRTILLSLWKDLGVKAMNLQTYLEFPRLNKMWQHCYFAREGLPFVPSDTYAEVENIPYKEYQYPLIVKNRYGSGGQKVFKADSPTELRNLLLEEPFGNLIQPFLPTGHDFRVIVIGGKAFPAAMKKIAPKGEFLTNVVRGGQALKVPLTKELKDLAERTAAVFKADYAGVDIMYDEKGKPYVLEVNRGAQFEGFEQSTGINVAQHILEWLVSGQ